MSILRFVDEHGHVIEVDLFTGACTVWGGPADGMVLGYVHTVGALQREADGGFLTGFTEDRARSRRSF